MLPSAREKAACLATTAEQDKLQAALVCLGDGSPSADTIIGCADPRYTTLAQPVRDCIQSAGNQERGRKCITDHLDPRAKSFSDCLARGNASDARMRCAEQLVPDVGKVRQITRCLARDTLSDSASAIACIRNIPGVPHARALDCLSGSTQAQKVGCLLGDNKDAQRAYRCATSSKDPEALALNCTDGVLDDKSRRAVACVAKAAREGAGMPGCAAQAILPVNLDPETARMVTCATSSQGVASFAVCSAAPSVNAECQIAAQCAVETGGNPAGFGGCVTTKLTIRELLKCMSGKIGTDCGLPPRCDTGA